MGDRRQPVKIILSVAGLVVAALIAWPFLKSAPGPETEYTLVCVATGEIFTLDVEKVGIVPARNPKTNERTLVPCVREEGGAWHIAPRFAATITGELADVNRVVDTNSLAIRSSP